jgi:hypothetical protein
MKKFIFLFLSLISQFVFSQSAYYIDPTGGNDANAGTSSGAAWKSWKNVYNNSPFPAGSQILIKRGEKLSGAMYVTLNGSSGSPCAIADYGSGAKPVLLGDFSNNVWIAVPGRAGYYKTYTPKGGLLSTEQFQYSASVWVSLTVMGDISPDRETWLSSMPAGSIGPTNNQNDTIFVRSYDGTAPTPATMCIAWDGCYLNNSKYVTLRNLSFRGFHSAIYMWADTNLSIRTCEIHQNDHLGVMLHHGQYVTVDSCLADSISYSCFYSYLTPNVRFSYDTVTNLQNIVKGRDWGAARELNAFGHQGLDAYAQGNSAVRITHCYTDNIYDSAVDTYLCINDTIDNNVFNADQAGIYAHGKSYYVSNNVITVKTSRSTRKGIQGSFYDPGLNIVTGNTFNDVQWGLSVYNQQTGATTAFSLNKVKGFDASSQLLSLANEAVSGTTSTNNIFCGSGVFVAGANTYSTLVLAQAAGWESNSIMNSDCSSSPTPEVINNLRLPIRR